MRAVIVVSLKGVVHMEAVENHVRIERVYDDPLGATGGFRVFADRLWPRGESKEKFHYDLWAKDITPSPGLREWYHADKDNRWEEFQRRYKAELESNPGMPRLLDTLRSHPDVVLLTAVRDVAHSHIPVIARYIISAK